MESVTKTLQFFACILLCTMMVQGGAVGAENRGADIVIEKKDGKFKGIITAQTSGTGDGLISDIELRFVWSGIFDQPTEYYQFIWNKSDRVSYAGKYFGRERLQDYPDLRRRFDALRPAKIELSLGVLLGSHVLSMNDYSSQTKVNDKCLQGYEGDYGCKLTFSKTITEIPHLMIAASGKVGDNITPTSPVDNWVGFFETRSLIGDAKEINRKLHDMMRRADKIRVMDLRLVSYTSPSTEISAIIEEFYKREAEEAEKELEKEATTDKEDEKSFMDKVTDFFGEHDGEESDDFWSGENESSTNKGDDFWSGEEVQTPIQPSTSHQAEIVTRGNEQGVLAKTGEILIPFRPWTISSYTDGIAEVSIRDDSTPTARVPGCGGGRIWTSLSGSVDQSGEWLAPPKRQKYRKTNVSLQVFYRSITNDSRNLTPTQKRARDQCRIQVQSQLNELERRYNVPVTNWK